MSTECAAVIGRTVDPKQGKLGQEGLQTETSAALKEKQKIPKITTAHTQLRAFSLKSINQDWLIHCIPPVCP